MPQERRAEDPVLGHSAGVAAEHLDLVDADHQCTRDGKQFAVGLDRRLAVVLQRLGREDQRRAAVVRDLPSYPR